MALAAGALLGQAPPATPAFEVATVRPSPPLTMESLQQIQTGKTKIGMSVDGARVDIALYSLADLIRIAYDVKPHQVQGPDWMGQQRFEIQAKIPNGVSKDLVPQMLQSLLAERFKLTIHREKKEQAVYALVVAKGGPKLIAASDAPDAPLKEGPNSMSIGTEKGAMKITSDGKGGTEMQGAGFACTIMQSITPAGLHLEMTKDSLSQLVDTLTPLMDHPIVDMTDLKGTYQFAMDLPMEDVMILAQKQMAALGLQMPGAPAGAPSDLASTPGGSAIFTAMEKLGLKLESRKAPIDTIVVDHLEKSATEN